MLTVLEAALPGLRLEQLARLVAKVPAVVLTLTRDLAAANVRLQQFVAEHTHTHTGTTAVENQASFS